jgi:transcriptional regulator with XRE-family HTH domain
VPEATSGSTVPRRQLGRYLRDARGKARLTVRAAAVALEWSEAKLWRIETGQTSLRSLDVEAMCRVFGVAPELTEALMALAKETKARGWWQAHGDVIPSWLNVYLGLEEAATELRWYEAELVPGLFQTTGYARAVITTDNPEVDPEEIERRVNLRMARQALLTRVTAPPTFTVALNEAVLRRPVGGTPVMLEQLDRLVAVSELPNVTLGVVPFAAGLHHGVLSGPFIILRFPNNGDGTASEPPTVYVEGFTGALYLDQPHEIERHDQAFERILRVIDDPTGDKGRQLLWKAIKELRE